MLTSNFSEIINVVVEQLKENKLEQASTDDIRNISLMLWGYLRLIKSGFKTKDDCSELSDNYSAHLKAILSELTTTQLRVLNKIKREFMDNFNSELNALDKKMDTIPNLLVLNSKNEAEQVALSIFNLKKYSLELRKKLDEELHDPYVGFKQAIVLIYGLSSNITEVMFDLLKNHPNKELSHYHESFRETFTNYLKRVTYWSEIEVTNGQCISYVTSGEFIDLLINS